MLTFVNPTIRISGIGAVGRKGSWGFGRKNASLLHSIIYMFITRNSYFFAVLTILASLLLLLCFRCRPNRRKYSYVNFPWWVHVSNLGRYNNKCLFVLWCLLANSANIYQTWVYAILQFRYFTNKVTQAYEYAQTWYAIPTYSNIKTN